MNVCFVRVHAHAHPVHALHTTKNKKKKVLALMVHKQILQRKR